MKSVVQLMDLTDRVAVVTGGGGHIGSAFCETLAELGAAVAVVDQAEDRCQQIVARLREQGAESWPIVADLRADEQVRSVQRNVESLAGRIDILVNCAAFVGTSGLEGWATSFEKQSIATWRSALELNLTVPFSLTQACAPALAASRHASVINVGSIYGLVGPHPGIYEGTELGNPAAYAASKGGLIQLTRWLATTLAPRVRVNAITPGGILRGQDPQFITRYSQRTPLGRLGTEEELKGALAFLASDLSSYVTGQNLVVDGGWTAW